MRPVFFIALVLTTFFGFGQTRFIKTNIETLIDLDSAISDVKNNPQKVYIVIYDKVDSVKNTGMENLVALQILDKLNFIESENLNVAFYYYHVPSHVAYCTPGGGLLKYKLNGGIQQYLPFPAPAAFIICGSKSKAQLTKTFGVLQEFDINSAVLWTGDIDKVIKGLAASKNLSDTLRKSYLKLDHEYKIMNSRFDSISYSPQKHFLSLSLYSLSLFSKKIISGFPSTSTKFSNSKLTNLIQLSFVAYPLKKYYRLGYGVGLSYSKLTSNATNESLIDTIDRNAVDLSTNGVRYTRVAYAKNIKETIDISYASFIANLSYKAVTFKVDEKSGFVSINLGIKLSNILTSTYHAVNGEMSWGGFYPGSKKLNDTIYSGLYDFYQNQSVYKGSKDLKINNSFYSGFASVDCFFPFKKFYFNASVFGDFSSSIQIQNQKEGLLAYNRNNYNSLLYRSDKMYINSIGIKLGVSYSF